MKKTRIMGLLLVFVLVTSCFAGGTFAKYTSQASGSDFANVAKWKFTYKDDTTPGAPVDIATNGVITFDLFNTIREADTSTAEEHVSATLIAPGTGGAFRLTVENASEVNTKYTIDFTEDHTNQAGATLAAEIPIQYSTDKVAWYDDIDDIDIVDQSLIINPGSGSDYTDTHTIYWRWAFNDTDTAVTDSDDDPADAHIHQTNTTDTDLGIEAAKDGNFIPKITITAKITATQVD